jgi:hypothetical protein
MPADRPFGGNAPDRWSTFGHRLLVFRPDRRAEVNASVRSPLASARMTMHRDAVTSPFELNPVAKQRR